VYPPAIVDEKRARTNETHSAPCGVNVDPLGTFRASTWITDYGHQDTSGEARCLIKGGRKNTAAIILPTGFSRSPEKIGSSRAGPARQ
jgi:hypothetical protein